MLPILKPIPVQTPPPAPFQGHLAELKPDRNWQAILNDDTALNEILEGALFINSGAFGAVYDPGCGVAIKIGLIEPEEAKVQQWVCETFNMALPVWAYREFTPVPLEISHEVCLRHCSVEERREAESCCHCGDEMSVLVMPLAEAAESGFVIAQDPFVRHISRQMYENFQFFFDCRPKNALIYRGMKIMCDFGDADSDAAEAWRIG